MHEASHHLLARRVWLNDLLGNLAGTFLVDSRLGLSRAAPEASPDDQPRRRPEQDPQVALDDPLRRADLHHAHAPLRLAAHAWPAHSADTWSSSQASLPLLLMVFMLPPRSFREWSLLGPLMVVAVLQNLRIVTGHMDLPAGKYHDTWQLVLPALAQRLAAALRPPPGAPRPPAVELVRTAGPARKTGGRAGNHPAPRHASSVLLRSLPHAKLQD